METTLKSEHRRLLRYSRLGSLSYLYLYDNDGVAYRDLKAALGLSDSQLGPQLLWLRKGRYVKVRDEKLDSVGLAVYYITEEGRQAYEEILSWMAAIPLEMQVAAVRGNSDKKVVD